MFGKVDKPRPLDGGQISLKCLPRAPPDRTQKVAHLGDASTVVGLLGFTARLHHNELEATCTGVEA